MVPQDFKTSLGNVHIWVVNDLIAFSSCEAVVAYFIHELRHTQTVKAQISLHICSLTRPRGYKKLFMLSSA